MKKLIDLSKMDKMKWLIISGLLMINFFIPKNTLFGQDDPKPDFFGVFAVSNGVLYEFQDSQAKNLTSLASSTTTGILGFPSLGTEKKFFSDPKLYFIIYGEKMNPMKGKKPMLSTITYLPASQLYIASANINLKVGPIPGLPDAYKLIPENPLPQGLYSFHSGRLKSTSVLDASVEANAQKDVWTFFISKEYMGNGQLSEVNLQKGEYTCPPNYGLFLIQNFNYIQIPVSSDKAVVKYTGGAEKRKVLTELSGVVVDSSFMIPWMVSNNEENIRGRMVNVSIKAHNIYKDIIPEKMVLSKLTKKTLDLRSEKDIKKGEPEQMTDVWVADEQVPYLAIICDLEQTLCRIVPVSEMKITAPPIKLAPGDYALHNGIMTDDKNSFGSSDIVYTFTVR
jgi:hypothetical protein